MKRLVLIGLLFVTGCAPWMQVGGRFEPSSRLFSVETPQGWMRLDTDDYLLMSEDGPFLQYVMIQGRPLDRSFRHTRKKFREAMLPEEAAEVLIDEIGSDPSVLNFEIVENIPATISGLEGFRLVFKYRTRDGLKLKTLYYGLLAGDRFYGIRYTAAERYYFTKDLRTFGKILGSFRLNDVQIAGTNRRRS